MNVLALETSSDACSVALGLGGLVIERHEICPREHTRRLLPMIHDVLAEAGLGIGDLDALVLGNGPGSFIGMRIGASIAQGLCYGSALLLVPLSSLAAVAAEAMDRLAATRVLVAQDAHMQEVYLASFVADGQRLPVADEPVRLQSAAAALDVAEGVVRAGTGWQRYPALLATGRGAQDVLPEVLHPRARYLLPLGRRALASDAAIDPADLQPAYVRERVAKARINR